MSSIFRRGLTGLVGFFLLLGLLAGCASPGVGPPSIDPGSGRFWYQDPAEATGKGLWVWYHRPAQLVPTTPIVFVMHGNTRNASHYRDNWTDLSEKYGFLIVAPEFDLADFPDTAYHRGNTHHNNGGQVVAIERRRWTYPIIDRIFAAVRRITGNRTETFSMFGHSAGGQFVHRYMTFTGGSKVDIAVAANAGWYTMPDKAVKFPYGLGGTAVTDSELRTSFGARMIVLLGERDILLTRNVRQTPEANRQGRDRLARGRSYFETAKRAAARLNCAFNWRLETVPGVGHKNRGMATPAAAAIDRELRAKR
jgi:hypothetical protein